MTRLFLLGPTASGKTAAGVALARRVGGEVLSLDSMLVYRGMDLGTAKPDAVERGGVPHHLIDLVDPREPFSVARYLEAARAAEAAVRARGRVPIYVGGTTMWFKALVHGLLDVPPVPDAVRAALEQEAADAGGEERLRAELERGDPEAAARIHPADRQRTLRALEVLRATGRPLSAWQEQWGTRDRIGEPTAVLRWERAVLHGRIEARFAAMLEAGLLEEIRGIRDGDGFGPTARKAIGYRQLLAHLDGACTLDEAVAEAVRATKVLVRRQTTWLRAFPDVSWIDVDADDPPESVAEQILARTGVDA